MPMFIFNIHCISSSGLVEKGIQFPCSSCFPLMREKTYCRWPTTLISFSTWENENIFLLFHGHFLVPVSSQGFLFKTWSLLFAESSWTWQTHKRNFYTFVKRASLNPLTPLGWSPLYETSSLLIALSTSSCGVPP